MVEGGGGATAAVVAFVNANAVLVSASLYCWRSMLLVMLHVVVSETFNIGMQNVKFSRVHYSGLQYGYNELHVYYGINK